MSQPLVSVLVPIYNVEKYIERCARSIFEQAYENLEIIFVNDCTPDNSVGVLRKVLAEYPNRIAQTQIINHEKNLGLAGARLTGLKTSTGKYIQNIDSDDYIDKNMISEMVALAERENADITICDFMYVYTNKKEHIYVNPPLDPLRCLESVLVGIVHSSVCNKLISRDLYVGNNIYPIIGLNMLEDLSVMFRLLYFAKKIAYTSSPFYNYNLTNVQSYTSNVYSVKNQENMLQLARLCHEFKLQHYCPDELKKAFDSQAVWTYCSIALCGDTEYLYKERLLFKCVTAEAINSHLLMSKKEKLAGKLLLQDNIVCFKLMKHLTSMMIFFKDKILSKVKMKQS